MKNKAVMLPVGVRIDWERWERSIHGRFGVNAVALSKDGSRKTTGATRWANGLCELIKTHALASEKICESIKVRMMREARAVKRHVSRECAAGIYRRLLPLIRDDEVEGFVSICV